MVGSAAGGAINSTTLTLTVTQSGLFELETIFSLPQENPAALGVILSLLAGPVGWYLRKRGRMSLSRRLDSIVSTYRLHSANKEECRSKLAEVREQIIQDLKRGKISEEQFRLLDDTVTDYLEKLEG